ncbi:hypothetical protein D4R51_01150 [bacterium]|nr:MAG: hypothetical protein D4R51_01150 [bacterium]
MSTKNTFILVGILALILAAVILIVVFAGGSAKPNPAMDAFAQCLASKNITMYGAYSCVHCQNEKKAFGSSFKYVPYVECTQETAKCTAAGIQGFPTWVFPDGKKLVGEQGIYKLSEESGCLLAASSTQ